MLAAVTMAVIAAGPLKLAAPGFACSGVDPPVCAAYLDRVASLLRSDRLKVTSASDIAGVLGLERQRQLLGCADQGQCNAELAGALGVDGVLTGNIVKTESSWLATLKIVHASDGTTWVDATARVRNEDALLTFLDDTAAQFASHLNEGVQTLEPKVARKTGFKWVPTAASGVVLVTGVVLFFWAQDDANQLRNTGNPLSHQRVLDLASRGRITDPMSIVFLSVGVAALVASIIYWAVAR